jgi:oligosaccharide repeat unit polymerase
MILSLKNTRYGLFHILIIFFSLTIIDLVIPSACWSFYGYPDKPTWFKPLTDNDILLGMTYYFIFYIIMFITYIYANQYKYPKWNYSFSKKFERKYVRKRLFYFLLISCSLALLSLYNEIQSFGGYDTWLISKFSHRFHGGMNGLTNDSIISKIPIRHIFHALVLLAFLLRYKFNQPTLYGIIFPMIDILLALSTSYRGSILQIFIGLLFIENIRLHIENKQLNKFKITVFFTIIVIAFTIYGDQRSNLVNSHNQNRPSGIYKILNQGSGAEGISSIMREYGKNIEFLYGKTYIDMLLLPIPRIIYTNKPIWYGIDDITRGMGWPESTQSAVTLPGEAYANFGWVGLLIAIFYGWFFARIIQTINKKGSFYIILYPILIIPMIFSSNWMAFSGIMSMFVKAIVIIIILLLIFIKFKIKKVS